MNENIMKGRDGSEYKIFVYWKNNIEDELPNYKKILESISNEAHFHPSGGVLERWLELSDLITICYFENEPIAFSTAGKLFSKDDLFYVPATMVSEKFQNKGLSSKLWLFSFRSILPKNLTYSFKPIYFIFRTPSPKLYSILCKKIEVYPNLKNKQPTESEKNLVSKASEIIWPNQHLNISEMIISNSYANTPWLLPEVGQINWSGNKEIDEFFERKLKLTQNSYDAFVILGKIRYGFLTLFAK